jgi:hypothetical protein
MSKSYTATELANLTSFEAFELADFENATVRFQNDTPTVTAPFTVTFDDHGATVTVHSHIHGPFDILSPRYNNLYMHNLETVHFS